MIGQNDIESIRRITAELLSKMEISVIKIDVMVIPSTSVFVAGEELSRARGCRGGYFFG